MHREYSKTSEVCEVIVVCKLCAKVHTKPCVAAAQYLFVEMGLKNDFKYKNLLQKILVWLSDSFTLCWRIC